MNMKPKRGESKKRYFFNEYIEYLRRFPPLLLLIYEPGAVSYPGQVDVPLWAYNGKLVVNMGILLLIFNKSAR